MALAAALCALLCSLLAAGGAAARTDTQTSTRVTGITVYAAASLTDVFPKIDSGPKYSFGASSTLAAQITQGAPADVFASANTTIPAQLFAKELVQKPVVFTRNRLVLVVPTSNPAGIHSVYDLKKPGVKLVIAAPAVPVGSYTLQVLKQMGLTQRARRTSSAASPTFAACFRRWPWARRTPVSSTPQTLARCRAR